MARPFLCTTALPDFWDLKANQLLFLGEWCRRWDQRHLWKGLSAQVLPYPWDDRVALHHAAVYEEQVYEQTLCALAAFLEEVHRERHSLRYWRLILGPWLLHHVQVLHERWLCLRRALERHPDLTTICLSASSFRIPRHFMDYLMGLAGDTYNLQLYSSILAAMGCSYPSRPLEWNWAPLPEEVRGSRGLRAKVKEIIGRCSFRWALRGETLLMEMYLPASLILALMAKTGFKARLAISPVLTRWLDNTSATTHPRRSDLNKVVCGEADPFLAVLAKTLPLHLPLLYLEGYAAAREWAKRAGRGARVRGFISATGYFIHEPVKFLAAELQENGVRLVATQHGGGYGQLRHHPCEALERAGADEYWSWGWTATAEEIRPLVHPKLSSWAMKATAGHPRQADYIYFIANNMPRYHYRTWSCPVGPQMLEYFQWQARFLGALPRALLDSLVFRCFPQDYDWGIRQRLKEAVPGLCLEEPGCNYHQGLLNARLVVCDMNMTTLLESLAANLPTVAFWDENRWEARPSAQPYLQQLQEAGILFHDPEAAAGAVSRYWPAPEDWWNTALVQEARRQFVHRYARTGPHWQGEWRQSLGDLLLRAKKMFLLPLPQLSPRRRSED